MKKGVWLDFPENVPNDGEPVLIRRKGMGNYWEASVYNEYHQCWDDAEGDDVMYGLEEVDKFMLIPDIE